MKDTINQVKKHIQESIETKNINIEVLRKTYEDFFLTDVLNSVVSGGQHDTRCGAICEILIYVIYLHELGDHNTFSFLDDVLSILQTFS